MTTTQLIYTFVLTFIMMLVNTSAKITMLKNKNLMTLGLTSIDTFIFVMLISDKGIEFAIIYTVARVLGVAVSLFSFNKKKSYIKSFTVIADNQEDFKHFVKNLQQQKIKYIARLVETKTLFNKEVVVFTKTPEASDEVSKLIPKNSLVITSKNKSIEIV